MARTMGDFLSELAENSALLAAYIHDPIRVLEQAGMTARQQTILTSGDQVKIMKEILAEYEDGGVVLVPFVKQHIVGIVPPVIFAGSEESS
jgi:hypothetical protein